MITIEPIVAGSLNVSAVVRIVDSDGHTPETGVTSATGGLDLKYRREGAAAVNLTESDLSALTDAHSDGGMLHIGAGYYRVDLPDAAAAVGAQNVILFGAVTGMIVIGCYIPLVDGLLTQADIDKLQYIPPIAWIEGTVDNDPDVSTATTFVGDSGLSASDNFYHRSAINFTSGALSGLTRRVTGYVGATKAFTVYPPLPSAPANGVTFTLIGAIE